MSGRTKGLHISFFVLQFVVFFAAGASVVGLRDNLPPLDGICDAAAAPDPHLLATAHVDLTVRIWRHLQFRQCAATTSTSSRLERIRPSIEQYLSSGHRGTMSGRTKGLHTSFFVLQFVVVFAAGASAVGFRDNLPPLDGICDAVSAPDPHLLATAHVDLTVRIGCHLQFLQCAAATSTSSRLERIRPSIEQYLSSGHGGTMSGRTKGLHTSFSSCRWHMLAETSSVLLASPPITHQSGMMFTMLAALAGITCVLVPTMMTPAQAVDTIEKYKVTTAVLFPSQLQAVLRELCRTGRKLPSVRTIGTGGSVLPPSVAEAAREAFGSLEQLSKGYGMTESCGAVTTQPKTGEHLDSTDIGVPSTGVTVKVVDVRTREKLGPHQVGEICFRTLSMVRGYYKRRKESAELFDEEGWCKSGDAGYYDEDGHLYFCERLKQMIKCMDNQVVPSELEDLLLREHANEIAEVSVVGLPHSEYGEAPAAAIVVTEEVKKEDLTTLANRIRETVASSLAVHKHLYGGVHFVDSLPKTETAKVNRPALVRSLLRA
nr:luciferin 4-monooxygenase-like isoform X1 [Dermacentor andersoni]